MVFTRSTRRTSSHATRKKPISIKLDEDVLDYFKGQGTRHQTHINAVLRAYMQAQRIVQTK